MSYYAAPIARLIEEFAKLPGIGQKTAQRLAFHILNLSIEKASNLTNAIKDAKTKVRCCTNCGNLTDIDPCEICASVHRDKASICVVENPKDVIAIERTREFKGTYHYCRWLCF